MKHVIFAALALGAALPAAAGNDEALLAAQMSFQQAFKRHDAADKQLVGAKDALALAQQRLADAQRALEQRQQEVQSAQKVQAEAQQGYEQARQALDAAWQRKQGS